MFGGIALATAPAPALSIVKEFHTKGPVTDALLPMTVLDDVVGVVVFFTVNSLVARRVSGGTASFLVIPAMILLPVIVGAAAAAINEIIAVIAAKKGFEFAGEIPPKEVKTSPPPNKSGEERQR